MRYHVFYWWVSKGKGGPIPLPLYVKRLNRPIKCVYDAFNPEVMMAKLNACRIVNYTHLIYKGHS